MRCLPPRLVALALAVLCGAPLAGLCGALVGGCGGSANRPVHRRHQPHPGVLDIYSSLPLTGPASDAGRSVVSGIRLALSLAGGQAGRFTIHYHSLNDARPAGGSWDATRTAANARQVATDAQAVTYIGDFDSAASQISLPILNLAGIPQISPWSPYVGLTQSVPGVTPSGEPGRYYPTSARTFLRIAPDSAVEVAAMLQALRTLNCTRLAVLRGGGPQSLVRELAGLLGVEAARFGMKIAWNASLSTVRMALRRYLLGLHALSNGCLAYVGTSSARLPGVLAGIHAALPGEPILASGELCSSIARRSAYRRLLAGAVGNALQCTLPSAPAGLAATRRFLAAWRGAYGRRARPRPGGTYGYAAMQLTLRAIAGLGSHGDDRSRLLHALMSARARDTVLGSFSFNANGDSTVRAFGLYQLRAGGSLQLLRVLQPPELSPDLS